MDTSGRATLDVCAHDGVAVAMQPNEWSVTCSCGHQKTFHGWRVRLPERSRAA